MSEATSDLPPGPLQIAIFGRKGQGKSELAWVLWDSWPYDRVVIDTTGSVGAVHPDPEELLLEEAPRRWPASEREADQTRQTLRYVPDHADDGWLEEVDRVVGTAYEHGDTLVWVEEVGYVAKANKVPPHIRRALHMGRHRNLWSLWTGPRPIDVDPLVLANADVVYCFQLANPNDQTRVADAIGIPPRDMADAIAGLGDHEFIRYVAATDDLAHFPALPPELFTRRRRTRAQDHFES